MAHSRTQEEQQDKNQERARENKKSPRPDKKDSHLHSQMPIKDLPAMPAVRSSTMRKSFSPLHAVQLLACGLNSL